MKLKIIDFLHYPYTELEFSQKYGLGKNYSGWLIANKKNIIFDEKKIKPILHRPFDQKWTYFDDAFLWRSRKKIMQHYMHSYNLGLVMGKSNKTNIIDHFIVTKCISEAKTGEASTQSYNFPLYLYPETTLEGDSERIPNLNMEIVEKIAEKINHAFVPDSNFVVDLMPPYDGTLYPEDILDYIYAVLHSPSYREKYKEFLKIDFPRVPYPKDAESFWKLVELGREIREIHLLESPVVEQYLSLIHI